MKAKRYNGTSSSLIATPENPNVTTTLATDPSIQKEYLATLTPEQQEAMAMQKGIVDREVGLKKGGKIRGDGIAQRGRTKGKFV